MNPIQLAAGFRGALATPLSGLSVSWSFGTVAAVNTNPSSVNVYVNNNSTGAGASTTNNLPYMSDYNPVVGDAVLLLIGQQALRSSYVVVGTLAGSSSGGGSNGLPIGATFSSPFVMTIPSWLLLNGSTFSATTYPVLYALNGNSNVLPDWRNFLPMGAGSTVGLGATTGSTTANGLISHTHGGPAHTHTSAAHSHNDSGHSHTLGGGSGFGYVEGGTGGAVPIGTGAAGWRNPANNDSASANISSTTPGATGSASGTTGSAGSGSSFSVLNPVVGVNWYVKAG